MKKEHGKRNMEKKSQQERGFTIVETLIAVAVLMIAIAGPLVIATKGLTSALVSKNQMIASYLAQDTMETVKNIRDNTLPGITGDVSSQWLSVPFNYSVNGDCSSFNNACDVNGIDTTAGGSYWLAHGSASYPIYLDLNSGYNHRSGAETGFSRRFYFEDIGVTSPKPEVRLHVIVEWNEGKVPYQVHVTSQLVGTTR